MAEQENISWFKKYWGWILAVITALALLGDAISGLQFLGGFIGYFSFLYHPPTVFNIVIGIIGFIGLALFIYYAQKETPMPKLVKNLSLVALGLWMLLIPQITYEKQERKFVIVFDEIEPKLNFSNDSIISIHIADVAKLDQVNQFENATIISTVSRPEVQWKKQFPKGMTFDSPIFSLQEVLNNTSENIVDISTLNHKKEIQHVIIEKQLTKNELRIFYEIGYESIANNLKSNLKEKLPNSIINNIAYDVNDSKNLINRNVNCVFITSNKFFKDNIETISSDRYNSMIVSNWMISSLENKNIKSNRHYATNSLSLNLSQNNYEVWSKLISLIKSEDMNIDLTNYNEIVRNKILTSFDNDIQIINF